MRLWAVISSVVSLVCGAAYAGFMLARMNSQAPNGNPSEEVTQGLKDSKPGVVSEFIEEHTSQPIPPSMNSTAPGGVDKSPILTGKCWEDDAHAQPEGECAALNCGHHYFGSEYPLTAEMFERSVPYTPNEDPLKDVILRAAQGGNITVYVVGGSMTLGGKCSQPGVSDNLFCAWQTRFKKWLKNRFPRANVQVVNKAIGACSTVCHMHNIPYNIPHDTKGVDLVIVDTGVNDGTLTGALNKEVEGSGKLRYWTEVMLRYLLGLDSRPAVLYTEGIYRRGEVGTFDVAEEHKKTTEAYGIPMVSYRDAIWPVANLTESGIETLNALWDADLHPSWKIHQLFADTLIHYIESVYLSLCAEDFKNVPGKSLTTSTLAPGGETQNSHNGAVPAGEYYSVDGPYLYKEAEHIWNKFKLPYAPHFYMFADIGGGVNVTEPAHAFSAVRIWPEGAWHFKNETNGKGGYSPAKFWPGSSVTFNADCGTGNGTALLVIGYLRSYNNMGRASIKINGEEKRVLDGLWKDRKFSIMQYAEFEVPQNPQIEVTITQLPKLHDADDVLRGGHTFRVDRMSCA